MSAPSGDGGAALAALIASQLRDVPDFPQPGILFKDISPLFADSHTLAEAVTGLAAVAAGAELVAGVEARGFVLAGALARHLDCGAVMVRKAGKLPPPTVRRSYDLEYGRAEIEVPVDVLDGRMVLLVDDVLATGGTLRAAAELIAQAGGVVTGLAVLLELGVLGGRAEVAGLAPLHSLLRL